MYTKEDLEYISSKLQYKNDILKNYTTKVRGLPKQPKGWAFVPHLDLQGGLQKIPASIAIPIIAIDGAIDGYEFRAISEFADIRYTKIFLPTATPLYNLRNNRFCSKVVVTEGAIDCEIIYQLSNMNVIASVSASATNYVLHILAFYFNHILLVYDNDEDGTGLKKSKVIQKFYKRFYKDVVSCEIFNLCDYTDKKDIGAINSKKERKKVIKKIEEVYNRC